MAPITGIATKILATSASEIVYIERYEKAPKHRNPSLSNSKIGSPSIGSIAVVEETPDTDARKLRSNTGIYDKNCFIICQKHGGTLPWVRFTETGKSMLRISKKYEDDGLFR